MARIELRRLSQCWTDVTPPNNDGRSRMAELRIQEGGCTGPPDVPFRGGHGPAFDPPPTARRLVLVIALTALIGTGLFYAAHAWLP
jgi:hypothetical protein